MADYSASEINSMRQDAIRRVQEMHRRSQNYVANTPQPQRKQEPPVQHEASAQTRSTQNKNGQNSNNQNRQNNTNNNTQNYSNHNGQNNSNNNTQNYGNQNGQNNSNNNTQNNSNNNGQNRNNMYQSGYGQNFQNPLSMLFGGNNQNFNHSMNGGGRQNPPQQPKNEPLHNQRVENTDPPCGEEPRKKGPLAGILDSIFPGMKLDEDKIIIVILIIMLAREGADIKLLLALGYLLM